MGDNAEGKRGLSDMSGERREAVNGLGVDLIPLLEEFEAFSCGQVGSVFV